MSDMMWHEATRDVEAEAHQVLLAKAQMATAPLRAFLLKASSEGEFEHRLALISADLEKTLDLVTPSRQVRQAVLAGVKADFDSLHKTADGGWLSAARQVVQSHQHVEVDGVLLDATTASGLVQLYDGLSPERQALFAAMPLTKAADILWKAVSKTSSRKTAAPWVWVDDDNSDDDTDHYGERGECIKCGTEVEFVGVDPSDFEKQYGAHGPHNGWWDHGGNYECPQGGYHESTGAGEDDSFFEALKGQGDAWQRTSTRKEAKDAYGYDWEHGDWAMFTNWNGAQGIVRVVNNKSTAWEGGPRDSHVDVAFNEAAWDLGVGMSTPQGTPVERHKLAPLPSGMTPSYREASTRKTAISADTLNSAVEFDSPFSVDSQGNVETDLSGYSAPGVYHIEGAAAPNDVEIQSSDWTVWSAGRSGQSGYGGGVMHASEQLSGGMAEDLLADPGIYVLCVVDDPEDPYGDPAGWIVLKHKSATTARKVASERGASATCPVCYRENVALRNGKLVTHQDTTREGNPQCDGTGKVASAKTAKYDTEVVERGPGDFWVLVKGPVTVDGVTIDSAVIKSFGPYRDRETAERFASYDLAEVKTSASEYPDTWQESFVNKETTTVDGVTVHTFRSTGDAYNQSQVSDDIKDGDVLAVPSEGVYGFLQEAWPIAVTSQTGEFHALAISVDEFLAKMPQYAKSVEVARGLATKVASRKTADSVWVANQPPSRAPGYQPTGRTFEQPCDTCGKPVVFERYETVGGYWTSEPVEPGAGSDHISIWCPEHAPSRRQSRGSKG